MEMDNQCHGYFLILLITRVIMKRHIYCKITVYNIHVKKNVQCITFLCISVISSDKCANRSNPKPPIFLIVIFLVFPDVYHQFVIAQNVFFKYIMKCEVMSCFYSEAAAEGLASIGCCLERWSKHITMYQAYHTLKAVQTTRWNGSKPVP